MTFVPQQPDVDKSKVEQPHFEIQVGDGRGLLLLRPRTFFGWLRVESLQLAIPEVHFPLDITGGMAQFQRQRCPVLEATISVERGGLVELLQRRGPLLAGAGFEEVGVELVADGIELTALARLREWTAELVVRVAVEAEERMLRLRVSQATTFGYIRRPAALLAHDLLCVLLGASTTPTAEVAQIQSATTRGLGVVQLRPLDWFVVSVLAPAGWRLPELDGLHLGGVTLAADKAALHWTRASEPAVAATSGPRSLRGAVDELAARAIDDALLRNDLAGAVSACRLEMTRRPERAAVLTERLLAILCARDASLREAEQLARESLARWPEFGAAHLALAAVESSRGRGLEAAQHFGETARMAEARGDVALAVRAAAAAARSLQTTDPARAVLLYERVLALRPNDREATDALAELYSTAGRWEDLQRLLQARLGRARDDGERLEAHLRVAELSFRRLRDSNAARADLQAAAKLAPEDRRVWELLAQVCVATNDVAGCIAALERLVAVLATSGDGLAQARALMRLADHYEELGDDAAALRAYRDALALTPDDAGAIERFAGAAARHGDAADAIGAYRRLVDGNGASDRRRRAGQQLLQLYVIIGDRESARALLPGLADEPAPDVLMGLGRLEEASDDYAAAAELWARAAAQLDGQHAASAELERARVCRAASLVVDERSALARAFALAPTGREGLAAASGLIRLAREAGDRADEAAWLDRLLACEPSTPHHAELALRRAQLFVDAGDAAGAARVLDALEAAGQGGVAVRRLRAEVHGALGDASARAAVLEALALEVGGSERVGFYVQAAHSRLDAGELEAAAVDVQAAEALASEDLEVRTLVAEIAWRRGAWEEAVVRYGELASESAGAARVEWTRRLAVADDRLGRSDEALAALELAVAASDAEGEVLVQAWRDLCQLHERLGNHAAAVACYRRAGADARAPSLSARVSLLRAAAEILHRRMGRHEDAAGALTDALALDAGDLATLDALDALQSEVGDDGGVMATLGRKLALSDAAPERRVAWLERLGELAAARGRGDLARGAFAELAHSQPQHGRALRWLAGDAAARGDEVASAALDERLVLAPEIPADEQRAARLRLAARARKSDQLAEAELHLWAAVELTPSEQQSPLLTELEEVYTHANRWADLAVVLAHHVRIIGDEPQRLELELKRVTMLTRALGTPKLAIEAAEAAITHHGREARLVAALAEAALAAGERELYAETVASQAAVCVDGRERARLLAEAATLFAALGDPARAEALAAELVAVELAPSDRLELAASLQDAPLALGLARSAVAALPVGDERLDALRFLVTRARAAGSDEAEREALVTLWRDGQVGDERERLLALLEAAEEHDAAAELVQELLAEALASTHDPAPLLERLRASARSEPGLRALADGLARAAALGEDVDTAVAWLREAAALRARLDDFRGSADALVAALGRRPGDEALVGEVESLLTDLNDLGRLHAALEQHLAERHDEARLPILRKLSQLAETLGDEAAAERWATETRRLEPPVAARVDMQALARTIVGVDAARLRRELDAAEKRLQSLLGDDDVAEVRAARRQLGVLYRDVGRRAEAFEQLSLVLSEEPSNVEVLAALVDVAEGDARWREAAELLEQLSHLTAAPAERAALLYRAGEHYLVQLRDKDAASERYLKAIDLDGAHAPTLRRLVDYFWSTGDESSVAEMAAALDDEAAFTAAETSAGTRARAALATATAGDLKRAASLGAALDETSGAAALCHAAVELLARDGNEVSVAAALRIVSGPGAKLTAVRRRLSARSDSDPSAAALAARLGAKD
jgi:tetratricopeptide repeat protein